MLQVGQGSAAIAAMRAFPRPQGMVLTDPADIRTEDPFHLTALAREEVPARVKAYVADLNKLYPPKYAKFGNSPLVSLDEVLFDAGSTTRGDNVSRGLWD
jgi:hypothetical protein